MSAKPKAPVIPIKPPVSPARRAKGGHQAARTTAISRMDARIAQLEAVVEALDQRMVRGGFNRPFQVALSASVMLHLLVLTLVTFKLPDPARDNNEKSMEVVLVNAQSKNKPTKAQTLAQHNLQGGGNTEADRRAKSPLPFTRNDPQSSDLAAAQKRVEQLEQQARQMMTQNKSKYTALSAPPQPTPQAEPQPDAPPTLSQAETERKLSIQRMEAEIAKTWDAYQKRPRRQSIGASAVEYRFARYIEEWRVKIERLGEAYYPQAAVDQKIYGSLMLTVSIKSNGTIENIEIKRSSGKKLLDDAAINIVRRGAPYAVFPADVAKDTDVLDISRTWRFTSSDKLETE